MSAQELYRYTELPSLIHLLTHRELTLLDPIFWDDKNDSNFIALYRKKCGLTAALALCFARSEETYHHWRVFASGPSGVRIHFDEQKLREALRNIPGLQFQDVTYLTLNELKKQNPAKERLPFLKRYPFWPEREARLLWQSESEKKSSLRVPISLSSISRITLSPWLHPSLVSGVKAVIKRIDGCSKLKIYQSTLISNATWLRHGESAV